MHRAFGMRVLKIRGRRANLLLLTQGRSKGLLLRKGFKDRAEAIKAKARVNHPRVGETSRLSEPARVEDMFLLPPTWTHEIGLPSKAGILELWDTHCQSSVCSSLPYYGPGEPISVLGHCTGL